MGGELDSTGEGTGQEADRGAGDGPRRISRCPECGADAGLERTPRARSWRDWRRVSALLFAGVVGVMYVTMGGLMSEVTWDRYAPPPWMHAVGFGVAEQIADGINRKELWEAARDDPDAGLLREFLDRARGLEARFPGRARVWLGFEPRRGREVDARRFGWPLPWYVTSRQTHFDDWFERIPSSYLDGYRHEWSYGGVWRSARGLGPSVTRDRTFYLEHLLLSIAVAVLGAFMISELACRLLHRVRYARGMIVGVFILAILTLNLIPSSRIDIGPNKSMPMPGAGVFLVSDIDAPGKAPERVLADRLADAGELLWIEHGVQALLFGAILYPQDIEIHAKAWHAPFWFPVRQATSRVWVDNKAAEEIERGPTGPPSWNYLSIELHNTRYMVQIAWGYLAFTAMMLFLIYGSMRWVTDVLSRQQDRNRRRAGRCVICGYQIGGSCGG